jgi:hypothetical protein
MSSARPAERTITTDQNFVVLAMDGLYCHFKPEVTSLIFFQDIFEPVLGDEKDVSMKANVARKPKIEVRLPSSRFMAIVRGVVQNKALDDVMEYAIDKSIEPSAKSDLGMSEGNEDTSLGIWVASSEVPEPEWGTINLEKTTLNKLYEFGKEKLVKPEPKSDEDKQSK